MSLFGSSQPDPPQPPRADDGGLREAAPAAARQEAARRPRWRWLRLLFNGHRPEPLPSYLGTVEEPEPGKLGVCCSGGGIRSAAFSLGALQSLQERGELRRASYLAAVSGGSYIAAAISMVAKTGAGNSDRSLIDRLPAFAQGSPEEQYLRNRCSYLAPTLADKVYLGLRIFLGLLVNLVFISLPLIGLALILTGWLYAPEVNGLTGSLPKGGDYQADLPSYFWELPGAVLLLGFLFGACTLLFRWRRETWERFFATWATRLLFVAVLLAVLLVGIPYLVDWLRDFGGAGKTADSVAEANAKTFGVTGLALLAGVVAQLGHFLRSKPAAEGLARTRKAVGKLGSATRLTLAYAAGALIGPLLLLLVFALTVAIGMAETTRDSGTNGDLVWIGFAVLALFAILYAFVDLTTWSLHPYYKRRLSSAFALKRVRVEDLDPEERNRVEAVGSTPQGIAVERDYDDLVPISKTALDNEKDSGAWPTLLVCAAANISDTAATPPGRTVTSFTFSAATVGGPLVGAITTARLEHAFDGGKSDPDAGTGERLLAQASDTLTGRKHRRRDLSLPAAVAMSGAAISPSMGKMTARPLRFLMALANVRLGVWVPNPRWVAAKGAKRVPSRPRPSYLARELFGINSVSAKYLYVTDGGHYENLGLVELLRRGCTDIYCLDASGVGGDGAELKTLGDAIALARTELDVEIEFSGKEGEDPEQLSPGKEQTLAKRDAVTATIKYPPRANGEPGATGTLVYVRNTMTDRAPWDVRAHHESDPRFPNNPTVDQLYTDQKFEAYRVLGAKAGASAYERLRGS
ncbi:MAG TPA: patatin-like phospholipase family protein [Solirubrobacterales bacterium]|nr:patatin-like phospholipase family protein [Solirubrobacterales bacterium]